MVVGEERIASEDSQLVEVRVTVVVVIRRYWQLKYCISQ